MEIIIAVSLLSVVMISLFQVKGNSIFLLEKTKTSKKQNDYINLLMDTEEYSNRNKNIYLDNYFNIKDDDIRREFKEVKIKVEDELLSKSQEKLDKVNFEISKFKTNYAFENGISKNIYRFKLEL